MRPILDHQSHANVQEKNPMHHKTYLFSRVILTRDNDIFKNQSEDTRRTKLRITFVMPLLDGQSYANVQEKNPLHHTNSLFSHVILTRDYDFFQKSIREYAKGKYVHKRLICQYWIVSLT